MNNKIIFIWLIAFLIFTMCRTAEKGNGNKSQDLRKYDIEEIRTQIKDEEPHDAKISITLYYVYSDRALKELDQRKAQIKKIITLIISNKFSHEMDSLNEYDNLHHEIMKDINSVLENGEIKKVMFRDFVTGRMK